jgi:hypothetical protein
VSADMITSKETGILGPLRPVWNTKKQEWMPWSHGTLKQKHMNCAQLLESNLWCRKLLD